MREFSHIFQTRLGSIAVLSIVALIAVAVIQLRGNASPPAIATAAHADTQSEPAPGADWQQEMTLLGLATTTSPSATSTGDSLSLIAPVVMAQLAGEYAGMQAAGTYTPQAGQAAADNIAQNVRATVAYKTYAAADFKTDPDPSYDRMLKYRADMQVAMKPILSNTQAEYAIYALYLESGDANYLRKLQAAADNYSAAAKNALSITVPSDAAQNHADLVNSLNEFASVLTALSTHAEDAIASAALLRSYNTAEADVVNSFAKIATYERLKAQ